MKEEENEICDCESQHPLVLQYQLTDDVVVCSNCNLSSNFVIPAALKRDVEGWTNSYAKYYQRWLNEDDFDELEKPSNEVNKEGLRITKELLSIQPFYYWWHTDAIRLHGKCPNCGNQMPHSEDLYSDGHFTCDDCRILVNEQTIDTPH